MFLPRAIAHADRGRAVELLVLDVVFLFLATLAVVLRLISRRLKRVTLAANDYWIIVALLFAYGNGFSEIVGVSLGVIGPHSSELSDNQITMAIRCLIVAEATWAVSTWALKISLLLFFVRIFIQKTFRIVAYILMVIVTLFCISALLFAFLNCRPIVEAVCGNQYQGWLSTSIVSLLTDAMILSLPIPSVWHLKLPRATRVALTAIFGIGFLVCIISILRILSIRRISPMDLTYTSVDTDIYSVLEPSLGIVSACLLIMRPLFEKLLPSRFRSQTNNGTNNTHNINANSKTAHLSVIQMPRGLFDKGKRETFQRLSDERAFPLEQMTGENISVLDHGAETNRSPTYRTEVETTPHGQIPDVEQWIPESGINVQREWTVQRP